MTTLTGLTPLQVLAVADAALEVAETYGCAVESMTLHRLGYVTFLTVDGDAPALAFELGLTDRIVHVYPPRPAESIEAFRGDWRGVEFAVQHTIPTAATP